MGVHLNRRSAHLRRNPQNGVQAPKSLHRFSGQVSLSTMRACSAQPVTNSTLSRLMPMRRSNTNMPATWHRRSTSAWSRTGTPTGADQRATEDPITACDHYQRDGLESEQGHRPSTLHKTRAAQGGYPPYTPDDSASRRIVVCSTNSRADAA